MEEYKIHTSANRKGRPDLLTILCILSFIGSGMGAVSNLFYAVNYSTVQDMKDHPLIVDFPGMDIIMSLPENYFVLSFILYSVSLFGAILMWRLKKIGFHFYTMAQIFLLFLPTLYPQFPDFPILSLIITILFIVLYASNLRYMK